MLSIHRHALVGIALMVSGCSGESATEPSQEQALDGAAETATDSAATDAPGKDASVSDAELDASGDGQANDASSDAVVPSEASIKDASPSDASKDAPPPDASPKDAAPSDAPVDGAPTGPLKVYVAPDGDDAKNGLTLANAVLTLKRAHAIIAQAKPDRDVEVRIAPGRYQGQKVTWTYTMPTHRITFMPLNDDKNRPIFDGCLVENVTNAGTQCPGGQWFVLSHSAGEETNLNFEYIRVERYQTAISLNGNRDAESSSNGSNRIFGCYFWKIGNVFNPALDSSTAAVRLVNSDDNQIVNNHFVDIVNTSSGALLHAIYAAHMSDRNLIQSNRFESGTGDPVRIRDFSNDNKILENRFIKIGANAYSDWYCDHEVETACTKPTPECPSWRNQFRDNVLDGSWTCDPLTVWKLFQDDTTTGCVKPAGAVRVSTSGNVQQTPPCSP